MKPGRLRRAGAPWRLLAHTPDGKETHDLEVPGTVFDELVVGKWIHIEQMDTNRWWMNIGGVTVWVTASRDGKPVKVSVYGPNDYDEPVDGCTYEVAWSEE